MAEEGFRRTITSDDNITYHLPTAEYVISGDYTLEQIIQKAKNASERTGKKSGILITQSNGRIWIGLEKE
jgi:hypothetical protein